MQFHFLKAKKGQKLCDIPVLQRAGLQSHEKNGQSQNSRYKLWQVDLQPFSPTCLHACIAVLGEMAAAVDLVPQVISTPIFLSCYVDSFLRKLSEQFLQCFSRSMLRKLGTLSKLLSLSAGVEITKIVDTQQKRNLALVRLSESILRTET